ncbi:helix-turn-helix domain-containing protein [Streptomyces sp. SID9944]|nr:helix-turn-helix domain-containing protein [Streptomyces sp. SID9944]
MRYGREVPGVEESRAGDEGEREQDYEPDSGFLHIFGQQLKLFRERAGLSRSEFGGKVGYSASTIASFEQGRRISPPKFIDQADELLDAGDVLKAGKEGVARAQYPAFFRDAVRLEAKAATLHVYATKAVPGLLQTDAYARAIFSMWRPLLDEETIDARVTARMARQEIFSRTPMPTISFVIEEYVLRRPLGGGNVMRGQLEQLLLHSQRRNVEMQVMPIEQEEHAALEGPFTLITTLEGQRIAYVEAYKDSRLYTERSVVQEIEDQYGILRAQALDPRKSLALVKKLLGET